MISYKNWLAVRIDRALSEYLDSGLEGLGGLRGQSNSSSASQVQIQQAQAQAQAQASGLGQYLSAATVPPPLSWAVSRKSQRAIERLLDQLPFRVVEKILVLDYQSEGRAYRLRFLSGHEMIFEDANAFPTDADIARVCLESSI